MTAQKTVAVLLTLAVTLIGTVHLWLASASAPWEHVLSVLYSSVIVIAGIRLGAVPAVFVALAAGGFSGAVGVLAHHESWVQPIVQTMLFMGVGVTAAKLAEWQRARSVPPEPPMSLQPDSPEDSCSEVRDASQMAAVERVIVGLARHFRTPVSSIEGAGWVLEDSGLAADKRQEFVGIVRKESHRLNRVLADVMDYAQARKPRFQNVNLSTLVDDVIQLAGRKDHGPLYVFVKDIAPGFPPIRCDPEQIRQALLNLATNSIQASPEGGQIEISARLSEGNCVIRVKDHGRGIPTALFDRVFDPFFTTRDGLGLGLPVALHVVSQHGGRMAIEYSSDQGTCMAVILPTTAPAV